MKNYKIEFDNGTILNLEFADTVTIDNVTEQIQNEVVLGYYLNATENFSVTEI